MEQAHQELHSQMTGMARAADGSRMQKQRVPWVDLAKGIGAVLVIVVHTMSISNPFRGIIMTFFMVMFFVLSSYTFHFAEDQAAWRRNRKKSAVHILLPAGCTWLGKVLLELVREPGLMTNPAFYKMRLYTLLFASGGDISFLGVNVSLLGPLWFFFCVFWGRAIFDHLHLILPERILPGACLLLSLVGFVTGKLQPLPFSLDIALTVMPLFYAGLYLRREGMQARLLRALPVLLVFWLVSYWLLFPDSGNDHSYMDIAIRRFTLYPVCLLSGLAGTLVVCSCCMLLNCRETLWPILRFFGRNSLYVLCVHCLDDNWRFLWDRHPDNTITCCLRIAADLCIAAAVAVLIAILNGIRQRRG